jgi:hypothetical protein
MLKNLTRSIKYRFYKHVDKTETCWNWLGGKLRGYGIFNYEGKSIRAHRFSYMMHKGKIPKGMKVCHTCDNTSCVHPDHLFLGTHQDNMDDKVRKGRQSYTTGETHGMSILGDDEVISILKLLKDGCKGVVIAEKFSVSPETISKIKKNQTWKHIPR